MGQAFDQDGRILGEAEGPTKLDVFRKLTEAHPNAHEIRIRSLMRNLEGSIDHEGQGHVNEEGSDKGLSERVADLERDSEQLGSISATLWLNYGDTPQNKSGFVIRKDRPLRMLLEVLEKLTSRR